MERRLTASERGRDAAEAKALELANEMARQKEAHEIELGAKSQIRNTPQCNETPCPGDVVTHERQELLRTVSFNSSSSSPAKVGDGPRGFPSISQAETVVQNVETSNAIERYSSSDSRLLEMETFPMLETQRTESPMTSFSKIGNPDGRDNGSDSELSDIPEPLRETVPRKEPQNSNTSKKKRIPPEATPSKPTAVRQNPPQKATTNLSSPIVPKSTRTYYKKRQRDEDLGGSKSHGKKRAKLRDAATLGPDSQVVSNKPVAPAHEQSGRSLQTTSPSSFHEKAAERGVPKRQTRDPPQDPSIKQEIAINLLQEPSLFEVFTSYITPT